MYVVTPVATPIPDAASDGVDIVADVAPAVPAPDAEVPVMGVTVVPSDYDALTFSLFAEGVPIIRDAGLFTYEEVPVMGVTVVPLVAVPVPVSDVARIDMAADALDAAVEALDDELVPVALPVWVPMVPVADADSA